MKKLVLTFGMIFLVLASCQNESLDSLQIEKDSLDIESFTGIQHDIAVNILASRFGGYYKGKPCTRAMESFTLTPYIEDADTLMYIAQYADGWDIYSANKVADMILFSSENGIFDINDGRMPSALKDLISESADAIRLLHQDTVRNVHWTWGASALTEGDFEAGHIRVNNKSKSRTISYSDVPSGTWVLLESENLSTEVNTSPKLIATTWDQGYPWNQYSKGLKLENGKIFPLLTGCVPIAVAQYLYYTHYLTGIPSTTINVAEPVNDGLDFLFSGKSSSIWDLMSPSDNILSGMNESAMFIGYIGRELDADYQLNGTSVDIDKSISYLHDVYSHNFSFEDFNYSYVKSSIQKKYPVLAYAKSNKKTNGQDLKEKESHVFIIERYRETTVTKRYLYGLVRDPWPSGVEDPYESDDVDAEGNVISYAYTNEIIKTEILNSEISMNWGSAGLYDDVFYNPWTSDWNVGDYKFNMDHKIYKRDDIK